MLETIIPALITGSLALIGVIITNKNSNDKMQEDNIKMQKEFEKKMEVAQATTNVKLAELTREVREHNNFAKRMPVVETKIEHLSDEMTHVEKNIDKLQSYHSD